MLSQEKDSYLFLIPNLLLAELVFKVIYDEAIDPFPNIGAKSDGFWIAFFIFVS